MRKQRLQFRQEEVRLLLKRWAAAESCAIIGVGSIGKSNLLQHLVNPDVQTYHLGEAASSLIVINIDPALLAPLPQDADVQFRCWAGYELLLHRLYIALYPLDRLEADASRFFEAYQALQDGTNPLFSYMGLRYFELALEYLFRRDLRIVFLFDEFEEMLHQMPPKFFQTLRGLRDMHKAQLMFGTFSRHAPENLELVQSRKSEMEPFLELLNDNTIYVGPYSLADARDMMLNLAKRETHIKLSPDWLDFILYITGRYAGLLRATFRACLQLSRVHEAIHDQSHDEIMRKILSRPSVLSEITAMWDSLSEAEKTALRIISGGKTVQGLKAQDTAVASLTQKRILAVDESGGDLCIQPPLLNLYIAAYQQ